MTGWECPKCGAVYAPFVEQCAQCGQQQTVTIGTTARDMSGGLCPGCGQERTAPPLTGCPMGAHYGTISQLNDMGPGPAITSYDWPTATIER